MNKFKLHPLQEERLNVDEWYRTEREVLEILRVGKLNEIQDKCTHEWEDGTEAWDWTSPPFNEIYCAICHKFR